MASTFSLAPSPKWYFLDAFGVPAAGGTLTTWQSDDHSTPKFVFSDAAGLYPYTDPIELDASGGTPVPMYWEFNGTDLYYIQVMDASGNLIFDLDNFPIIGGGGSTPITTNIDIENHLINGAFLFIDAINSAGSLIQPIPTATPFRIAPAAGFFKSLTGSYEPSIPNNMSGWQYLAVGGAGSTSSIQFVDVTNIGEGIPNAPSANATRFFRYQLSATGTIQTTEQLFQVIPGVETFSGELLTITFDARANTAGTGSVSIEQFFGTGGTPSSTVTTSQSFAFPTTGWARLSLQITVPSVVGKLLGTNGDSSVNVIWNMPLNTIGIFDLANLQVQRGNFGITPYIYQTYNQDQYKVLVDLLTIGNLLFQSGELRFISNNLFASSTFIPGWLLLFNNAQTIGSTTSGASTAGFIYKNLYVAWWNSYPQSVCVVIGGRGLNALADFNANKAMTIPSIIINSVIAPAGNSIPFGLFEGSRTNTLGVPNLPPHSHSVNNDLALAAAGSDVAAVQGTTQTGLTGSGVPVNNVQPTTYVLVYAKL